MLRRAITKTLAQARAVRFFSATERPVILPKGQDAHQDYHHTGAGMPGTGGAVEAMVSFIGNFPPTTPTPPSPPEEKSKAEETVKPPRRSHFGV